MRYIDKIFFFFAIALAVVNVCKAQAPPPPPAKPAKTIGKANIYHFPNKSKVESTFLSRNKGYKVKATYEVPTRKITRPDSLTMIFEGLSTGASTFRSNRQFAISIDKKEVFRGGTKILSTLLCDPKSSHPCYEVVTTARIPYDILEKALKAKQVSITFGESIFELSSEEIRALGDLNRAIESP